VSHVLATRFGRPLPDGGTIGVPAPSGPYFNTSEILRCKEWWEDRGYRVKLGEAIWDRDDYVAGTPERRGADINAMFSDPEVDVVQCLWGGVGAAEVLPHVDFGIVDANPKAFMGFSDITHLHTAIRQETGLATFHGPGFGSMGIPERTDFSFESAVQAFKGHADGPVARDPDDPYVRTIVPGTVTAPLVGGNLYTLQHGFGTRWEVELDGCILFFEDVNLPPYQLDDLLTHFRSAGKLEGVVGVVVGEMFQCDWRETRPEAPRTRSLEDVLERQLVPLGVPVIYKLPLGHGKHLATIPLGVPATLDAEARSLTIDHPGAQPASSS
jgi:muramoyltetrapeptide carboxypeptidase